MYNSNIVKWLELLVKQLEFYTDVKTGKDKLIYSYKVNSIKKALKTIKKLKFKIDSGEQLKKIKKTKKLEGVGDGTLRRIDEILETGKLSEVNDADISGQHLEYVEELMKVFGIGRVTAYKLYTEHKITNIKELKAAIKSKKIDISDEILKGLEYVSKIKGDIPRSEMDDICIYLINIGINFDPEMDVRVCGSYRREKETSGDIDIIIAHPKIISKKHAESSDLMQRFIERLESEKFIVDSFTSKNVPTKYMGICRLNPNKPIRRIDIRYMPQESYYTAILYFTGSRDFNRKMRGVAITMDYKLNEYALLNSNGTPFKITSEEDVFDKLNMEYLQPKYRI